MGLMLFSVGSSCLDKILAVRIKVALPCPASVIEASTLDLPGAPLFRWMALFSREAFSDLLGARRRWWPEPPPHDE